MSNDEAEGMVAHRDEVDDGVYSGTRSRKSGLGGRHVSDTSSQPAQRGKQGTGRGRGRPRGQSSGRGGGRGRGRGRGRRRGRGATESRGRGGKGLKRGPRPALEPSKKFATLQKEAIDVWIDHHDHDKALNLIQQAISINPEVYAAHALMSEIYFAKGDDERGVASLFSGAHAAPRDADVWHQVADACLLKNSLDREQALRQAAYCFARIVEIDQNDLDSRFQRAAINRELGLYTSALREFDKILMFMPHNPSVLQQIAEICLELGELDKAKELYQNCISFYEDNGLDGENTFSWSDVNVYVELFSTEGKYVEAIAILKSLSRWLLGRAAETYWNDVVDDDREWDPADSPRRITLSQFVPGHYPTQSYGFGLPLELRAKLGIYRLKLGKDHRSEALNHFEWLEPEDSETGAKIFEYSDLFREVGDALRDAKEYEEALRFFWPLKTSNAFSDTGFWLAIGASSYVCGNIEQARECYELAKASDELCAEARTQLAKIYKDLGRRAEALRNAQEALEIGRRMIIRPQRRRYERREAREVREAAERQLKDTHRLAIPSLQTTTARLKPFEVKDAQGRYRLTFANSNPARESKFEERAAKRRKLLQMTDEEAEAFRTANVQTLFSRLQELTPAMRNGDLIARDIWLECADDLMHDFRSTKVFYPAERHMRFEGFDPESKRRAFRKRWAKGEDDNYEATSADLHDDGTPAPLIETSIPTEYRGISFDSWLDIFLEQALILARLGEDYRDQSYETITAVLDCTIWYHQPQSMLKTHVCYLTCALAFNDGETMCNVVARWFMKEYQFVTDVYRLFAALNMLYSGPLEKGGKDMQIKNAPFRQGACQKFMFRSVKAVDFYLPQGYNQDGIDGPVPQFVRDEELDVPESGKAHLTSKDRETGEPIRPKEIDIVLLCLYASIMYTANSFPNALHYFYRAYALDPQNPMLLLNMALCYVHQSFKRQNENRHLYVMQGLAFFQEYADARLAKVDGSRPKAVDEAEMEITFNRARIWHMLNLTNLAVEGYKKVVETSRTKIKELDAGTGFKGAAIATEAAYALQTTYALSGDMEMAQRITEEWLVV
jgi:general transcription factor 3C polypeptide 3 (transcription factor C subunit 4)